MRQPHLAVSMFSNCGAGDIGYAGAGFDFLVLAEIDKSRLRVASLNHPDATAIHGDVRSSWLDIVEESKCADAPVTLLAACPPCQGMSTANSLRGASHDPNAGRRDPRNLLAIPIIEVAKKLQPRVVVVENVPAFLTKKVDTVNGHALSAAQILIENLSAQYRIFPFLCDLADFGVPQTRVRCFLTFIRKDLAIASELASDGLTPYPIPSHSADYGGEPISLSEAMGRWNLPSLDASSAASAHSDHPLHFVPIWSPDQYAMVEAIPVDSGLSAWDNLTCPDCLDESAGEDDVTCPICGTALRRPTIKDENGDLRLVKGFRRSSYRRNHPQTPASTITTASGRISSDRTIHPNEHRLLSPLECALVQTIPDDFKWKDEELELGASAIRQMIGEAVPPLFTLLHGRAIVRMLSGVREGLLGSADPRCTVAWGRLGRTVEACNLELDAG